MNASVGTVAGGTGSDTLNAFAKGSSFTLVNVGAVETINLTLDAVDSFDLTAGHITSTKGVSGAATTTIAGGKAAQTYGLTIAGTNTLTDIGARTIDASQLLGSFKVILGDDALVQTNAADAIKFVGGQGTTDQITTSMSSSNTGAFTMSGIETLIVGSDTGAKLLT